MAKSDDATRRYRTIFISDLHLGTRGCQAELVLDFLRHNDADTFFLVGDIVDGWRLRGGWYWPQAHNDVIQKLLRKVRHGARMIFVPGNHDEFARQFIGLSFGGIEIVRQAIHVAADGRRYLIMHGDEFDVVVRHSKWLAHLGDWAYDTALFVNTHFNTVRRLFGFGYWSISAWAKLKVKNAVNFIGIFEARTRARSQAARRRRCRLRPYSSRRRFARSTASLMSTPAISSKSCSLVVEHDDGRLEIVRWSKTSPRRGASATRRRGWPRRSNRNLRGGGSGGGLMRILVATDAWRPQINGVVHTLERMSAAARELQAEFVFLTPQGFPVVAAADLSRYSSWRSPRPGESRGASRRRAPTISTSPPRGRSAGGAPLLPQARVGCSPPATTRAFPNISPRARRCPRRLDLRGAALVSCARRRGAGADPVDPRRTWRGAALRKRQGLVARRRSFALPAAAAHALDLPRPIFLNVGRVAVEKNLEALLSLDLPGSTVIVGDGPARAGAGAPLSARPFPRRAVRAKRWRADLRERRCLRLSQPHRHVRHRADRGAGERPAGRRLPGRRAARRDRRQRRRRARRGSRRRLSRRARHPARARARTFPAIHLARERAAVPRSTSRRVGQARGSAKPRERSMPAASAPAQCA